MRALLPQVLMTGSYIDRPAPAELRHSTMRTMAAEHGMAMDR
ncbi:hypothetical protein ACFWWB_25755 [Streptomyces sp. NPDC058690]